MQVPHAPAGLAPPIVSLEDLPMQCHVGLVVQLNPRVFWWDCFHDDKRSGDVRKVPGDPLDDVADCARYGPQSGKARGFHIQAR